MIQPLTASKIVTQPPIKIRVADIESGLNGLWAQFNPLINRGQTVMRACMSNLIIYCDSLDEAEIISQELIDIVDAHPVRVILLIGKADPQNDSVEAYVSIYHTTQPDGIQVCAERIDVMTSQKSTDRLPSVTRSHLIGDLPTSLWWASRQPPPDAGDIFLELAELADQIIYDNMGWANPIKGVNAMTRWVASQQDAQVVYNLAWRRTAVWRKLIGQVLDPLVAPDALDNIRQVKLDHGPHALAMSWQLVGWLACQLQRKPSESQSISNSEMLWKFRHNDQDIKAYVNRLPEGEPLLYRLTFNWSLNGQERKTKLERLDQERISIIESQPTAAPRVYSGHIPQRSMLVSAQLAHRDRDKVFERALRLTSAMSAIFSK